MLREEHNHSRTTAAEFCLSVRQAVVSFSPALIDIDAVYFVGTDGDLGQSLDHMLALKNHVSL